MVSAFFLSGLRLPECRNNTGEQTHGHEADGDRFSSWRVMRKTVRNHSAHDPTDKTGDQHGHGVETFMNNMGKYQRLSRCQALDEVV